MPESRHEHEEEQSDRHDQERRGDALDQPRGEAEEESGERTAEQIKMEIGSAFTLDERLTMEIKGRHLIEGVPKTITISDDEIRDALAETVNVIVDAVRVALERTPPELSADIVDRGIVLTGGGSVLRNLDKRLRVETGLPVAVAEYALSTVVLGAGKMLSNFELLRKISLD